jgi:cytochrome P450
MEPIGANSHPDGDFDPFSEAVTRCPQPHLTALRHTSPVLWSDAADAFVVTSHELVMEVARDPARFSSSFGRASRPVRPEWQDRINAVMAEGYPRVPVLLGADPPLHTRQRRLVSRAFSPKGVAAMEGDIRAICRRLLDGFVSGVEIDFVERFSVPLPVEVIARALNVPDDDLDRFKAWSDASTAGIGTDITVEQLEAAERSINEFQRYFADQLDRRRSEPQDDLLTKLLNARIDDDDPDLVDEDDRRPLGIAETLRIIQQLLVAGNETTTSLLADIMVMLADRTDEWQRMRDDPERIPVVVEEALRLASPSSAIWRIAVDDTELGGVTIPAGSRLIVTWLSANHDEAVFGPESDRFDPDREHLRDHVAFGFGIHHCVGAPLSRLETRVALEEMTQRIEHFELSRSNEFTYHPSFFLRGLTRLDLTPTMMPRRT